MNIFVLDDNPALAAIYQCDKHVVKMVLETGQLLSTVHRMHGNDDEVLYKATHMHHPCTKWASLSVENYDWLYTHFVGLACEYEYRYGRMHATYERLKHAVVKIPQGLDSKGKTKYTLAMPDEYKCEDAVTAYRNYYMGAKRDFLTYTKRGKPSWLTI